MRDKFSELIAQGVAAFGYTNIAPEIPEQDFVCRMYNNIFSIPTDTHMHYNNETGERYITGHMIATPNWDNFVYASSWGAVTFKPAGYWSLCDFLQKNGLKGEYSTLNGDTIYLVAPIPESEDYINCVCPTCCTTTESRIPQPVANLVACGDIMKIKECYHNKKSLYEVAYALNENIYIKGDDWAVNGDKLMCPVGNKIYIL